MSLKIVGISGSPVKKGNVDNFLGSIMDMIPATNHASISPLGAAAVASKHGEGNFDPSIRIGIKK